MPALCWHFRNAGGVLVNITVRHVPPEVRDEVARRAARRGQSSQEFLWTLLSELAEKPDRLDVIDALEIFRHHAPHFDVREFTSRGDDGRY